MKPTTELYHIIEAIVPLYVAMIFGYISFKWLKIFTKDQCSGINKFVAKFSIPLLSFEVLANSNPYKLNLKLIIADSLQKVLAFSLLVGATKILVSKGRMKWVITGLSLSTLPNTLIVGIPLLRAMYGEEAASLLAQIVLLQSLIWYNFLLFLFELNATKEPHVVVVTPQKNPGSVCPEEGEQGDEEAGIMKINEPTKMKSILINLSKVGGKLIINPNTHATLLGLIWGLIHFKYDIQMPKIVDKSIKILSDGGLGMSMFSLGLFMASQASIIPCGTRNAIFSMIMRFILGPGFMALSSIAFGIKGTLLKFAVLQAALPQGIVPFVFAKEYDVHPDIMSTGVILGLLVAVPVALSYYYLMSL